MSNLPVQWLWPGLCTSAGKHWGCVAQRWLRHLHIVAPEKQLVMWCWWHHYEWLTGGLWRCLPGIPRMWWCNEYKCYSDQQSPLLHLWMHPQTEVPGTHTRTGMVIWQPADGISSAYLCVCVAITCFTLSRNLLPDMVLFICRSEQPVRLDHQSTSDHFQCYQYLNDTENI